MRPQAMLEAKDLPKCDLSNYLSERLDSVLEHDRKERADRDGCPIEHVSPFPVCLAMCGSGLLCYRTRSLNPIQLGRLPH